MLKKPWLLFCGLMLAAVFAFGMARLFSQRFDRGDIYPAYSSLRSDPLGTSVLYESLGQISGVNARRYLERALKEADGQNKTLLVLGMNSYGFKWMSRDEFTTLEQFLYSGGRVVIAYYPAVQKTYSDRKQEREEEEKLRAEKEKSAQKKIKGKKHKLAKQSKKTTPDEKPEEKEQSEDEAEISPTKLVNLEEELGFETKTEPLKTNEAGEAEFPIAWKTGATGNSLPTTFTLHTALYFSNLTNGWSALYERDHLPVAIERHMGAGTLVMLADSYEFSNEAAFKNAEPRLLSWAMGGGHEIIFDEAHLGVFLNPGVASLMRKYRLHGLFFSLALIAVLFIWKNSTSLVPPRAESSAENRGPLVLGKDANSGFVNLLRRGIPRAEIINACLAEWNKNRGQRGTLSREQRQQIEALVLAENREPTLRRNPVATYRAIAMLLRKKA